MRARSLAALLGALLCVPSKARLSAQSAWSLGSPSEDRARLRHLTGDTSAVGFLLRSTSSQTPRLTNNSAAGRALRWQVVLPEIGFVYNATMPWSQNDGSLWAGRGANVAATSGVRADFGPFRVFVLPEFTYSANDPYPLAGPPLNPLPRASRSPFSSPWHDNGQSIDLPIRMGDRPLERFGPGQSTALVDFRGASFGASTENEWWGPGIRNALLMSNNASGFSHLFARTNRPWRTRAGTWDARWIVGWLNESPWFDFDAANDIRSVSAAAIAWTPRADSNLTIGAARSVFAPARSRGAAIGDAMQLFAHVGAPNARPYLDSTVTPGRDQLLSLFARWVFPNDGFEVYAEWGRAEFPVSLHDFFLQPNHTQGYTLGFQWLGEPVGANGRLRAQTEFTFIEQSPTFRFRNLGSWYTSRAVVQGYTNKGQPLGASIGPGSSSQWVALDYVLPDWQIGAFFARTRSLEDAHSQMLYVTEVSNSNGWCEHDVSLLPGARGALRTRFGEIVAEYSSGWRLNRFFEYFGFCPTGRGIDVRTNRLSVRLSPPAFPRARRVAGRRASTP